MVWIDPVMSSNSRKIDLMLIALLFLLTCVFFSKILFYPDQMIYRQDSDNVLQFYPWNYYAQQTFKNGSLPHWISNTLGGEPFISNSQTAFFYPINMLLFSLFPAHLALGYSYLLHIFLTGSFMYVLMRYLKVNHLGSFVSAIVFMFSGFFIAHTYAGHYTMILVSAWIPLIFLFYKIALNKSSLFYGLATGIFLAIQFLGGHMQTSLYILLALGIYLIYHISILLRNRDYGALPKPLFITALAFTVSLSLSAILLIPSYEFTKYITRAGGVSYDFATSGSFPLQNAITFVMPNFFGNPLYDNYWRGFPGLLHDGYYWELTPYVGILPLFLAFLAIYLRRDDKYVVFYSGLAFLSLLFALGSSTPLYSFLLNFIPGFNMFRVPARFLFLTTFSTAVLSGFGYNALKEDLLSPVIMRRFVKIFLTLIILLISLTCIVFLLQDQIIQFALKFAEKELHAETVYQVIIGELFILISLSICSVLILFHRVTSRFQAKNLIVIVLIISNLWFYHIGFIDVKDVESIYAEPEYVLFIKDNIDNYRVYDPGNLLSNNYQILYGLQTVGGYNPLMLEYYVQFIGCIHSLSDSENHPILNLLSVRYVLTDEKLNNSGLRLVFTYENNYVYENVKAYPKAYLVRGVRTLSQEETLNALKEADFNPLDSIIVGQELNDEAQQLKELSGHVPVRSDEVQIIKYTPNEVVVKVNITQPAFLVLSEVYYPEWAVYVDGKQQTVHKAYDALRAVYLDEGQSTVEFLYSPASLTTGSWITLGTIVIVISSTIIHAVRSKRRLQNLLNRARGSLKLFFDRF